MGKVRLAVIGGSGLERLLEIEEHLQIETKYGTTRSLSIGKIAGKNVAFVPRHRPDHSIPPHRINYRANIYALHELGVERVLATNAVGAINRDFSLGDLVVPHDFIDFTKNRCATFYDEAPVTHIDLSQPYCRKLRNQILEIAKKVGQHVWSEGVFVCTEGPRLETPAEIEMFRRLGCDIVGMTGFPEVVLARELEMCYATICYVSNMAAGIQRSLAAPRLVKVSKQVMPSLKRILTETIRSLPSKREDTCSCASALGRARFE